MRTVMIESVFRHMLGAVGPLHDRRIQGLPLRW